MHRFFSIVLISVVFLAFGFGAFLMLHKTGEPHSGCVPTDGIQCRTAMTGASSAILHISALARPAVIPAVAALAILLFAAMHLGTAASPKPVLSRIFSTSFLNFSEDTSAERKLRAWLSIHEKRDPSFMSAVNN